MAEPSRLAARLATRPPGSWMVTSLRVFLFCLGLALFAYVAYEGRNFQPKEPYSLAPANKGEPITSPDETGAAVAILTNRKNVELYTRCWSPAGEARAVLVMVHGYTFHSRYFQELAESLMQHGFKTCALDLTGHGRSGAMFNQRAYVESMQDWVDDVVLATHFVHQSNPGLPIFLYGESLGGCLLLRLMCNRKSLEGLVEGYILSNPPVKVSERMLPPRWIRTVLQGVGIVLPMLPVPSPAVKGSDWKQAFGDQELAEAAYRDPLVVMSSPRLAPMMSVLSMTTETYDNLEQCSAPFLALNGLDDTRIEPGYIQELFDKASSVDKMLHKYPGMRHQLLQETAKNKAKVFADISAWLLEHLPAASERAQQRAAAAAAAESGQRDGDTEDMAGAGPAAGQALEHTEL